jgi:hypothetical protein
LGAAEPSGTLVFVQRLLIFCSDIEPDLERVKRELLAQRDPAELATVELEEIEGPQALANAGWVTVSVVPTSGEGLESHLEATVKAFGAALADPFLAIYVSSQNGYAHAHYKDGGFPHTAEGEIFDVVRQAAGWVETDAVELTRFLSLSDSLNALRPGANAFSEVHVSDDQDVELDADDRFVEARLQAARKWMERYLSRKP